MKNRETLRSHMNAATISAIKTAHLWQSQLNQLKFREAEWLARMETILEVLNEGVVIADDRPRILFANSRFVETIDIPAVELIGFDASNFYSSQEWDFVAKQVEDLHLYEKRAIRTRSPSCLDPY